MDNAQKVSNSIEIYVFFLGYFRILYEVHGLLKLHATQ
jgi:hypothetical protein